MNDCSITLEMKDGQINITATNMSLVELATMCGFIEMLAAEEAIKRGRSFDEVQDHMLDIHLEAMQTIREKHLSGWNNGT